MNLLLLLSALLSALTGANMGARAQQAAPGVRAEQPVRPRAVLAATVAAVRPRAMMPTLRDTVLVGAGHGLRLPSLEPIFAGRRRE